MQASRRLLRRTFAVCCAARAFDHSASASAQNDHRLSNNEHSIHICSVDAVQVRRLAASAATASQNAGFARLYQ